MERKELLVCCVAGLLGLLSAATGFAAEATRIKGSQVQFVNATQCEYPRTAALGLGFTSAMSLVIAHIMINVSTGCICCKRIPQTSSSNWTIALICFVVSWFSFVVAFLLLLTGSALNDRHGVETMYFGSYYCYVVKPGVFAGGAVLSLASVVLGIFYYLTICSAKKHNNDLCGNVAQGPEIAMGQPQFPAHSNTQEPVFVHEDTYIRRQFT